MDVSSCWEIRLYVHLQKTIYSAMSGEYELMRILTRRKHNSYILIYVYCVLLISILAITQNLTGELRVREPEQQKLAFPRGGTLARAVSDMCRVQPLPARRLLSNRTELPWTTYKKVDQH